jgi:hypothetical protein
MMPDRLRRSLICTLGVAALVVVHGVTLVAAAETGVTFTPDRAAYLVNKDVGSDRWTIGLNVIPGDASRFVNVTGNVFRSDGGPPSFVVCQVNVDSTGRLDDPASIFSFSCRGAEPCATTATECSGARFWTLISDDVQLNAGFFLPGGGVGSGSAAAQGGATGGCRGLTCLAEGFLRTMATTGSRLLAATRSAALPAQARAQSADRGATLAFDRSTYLVNKDLGNERWSIALNVKPVETGEDTTPRIQSVTGNVLKRDGSAPSFIYCTERTDSQGSLADSGSEFRLACLGTNACGTSATECAQGWELINDDVALPASFFLPPGGLPAPPQSDPDIFIVGNTGDPSSSLVSKDFTVQSSSQAGVGTTLADACPVGSACTVARIGACDGVGGTVVDIGGFGCGCQVDDFDSCVTCGAGASGTCGGDCDFQVGRSTARGQCLPASSDSNSCACAAIGAGKQQTVTGCNGALDSTCGSGSCCADDPRDGCNVTTGDVTCPGICVASSCAAGEACGICLGRPTCPNGVREGNEQCDGSDVPRTCQDLGFGPGTVSCTQDCRFDTTGCSSTTFCGDDEVQFPEQCDRSNLNGKSCQSLGFSGGGTLSCKDSCQFDTAGCVSSPCGDNVVQSPEQCDGSNLNGKTCQSLGFVGGGTLSCNGACQFNTAGCSSTPPCGDNVVQSPEQCDGSNLNGKTCQSLGFAGGGTLSCSACQFNTVGCSTVLCGDGAVQSPEQCDGSNLNGKSCQSLGFSGGGTLSCDDCQFDTSGCSTIQCGDNVVQGTEQCDGSNLNGKTCQSLGFPGGGSLACSSCQLDTSGCSSCILPGDSCVSGTCCPGLYCDSGTCVPL